MPEEWNVWMYTKVTGWICGKSTEDKWLAETVANALDKLGFEVKVKKHDNNMYPPLRIVKDDD